jgi:hypothetical protein
MISSSGSTTVALRPSPKRMRVVFGLLVMRGLGAWSVLAGAV